MKLQSQIQTAHLPFGARCRPYQDNITDAHVFQSARLAKDWAITAASFANASSTIGHGELSTQRQSYPDCRGNDRCTPTRAPEEFSTIMVSRVKDPTFRALPHVLCIWQNKLRLRRKIMESSLARHDSPSNSRGDHLQDRTSEGKVKRLSGDHKAGAYHPNGGGWQFQQQSGRLIAS